MSKQNRTSPFRHQGGYPGLPVELWREVGQRLSGEDLAYAQALSRAHRREHGPQVHDDALGEILRGRPMTERLRRNFQSAEDFLEFIQNDFPAKAAEAGRAWADSYILAILRSCIAVDDRDSWRYPGHFGAYLKAFARSLRIPYLPLRKSIVEEAIGDFRSTVEYLRTIDPRDHFALVAASVADMTRIARVLHSLAQKLGPRLKCSQLMDAIVQFSTDTRQLNQNNVRQEIYPVGAALDVVTRAFLPGSHRFVQAPISPPRQAAPQVIHSVNVRRRT